MLIIFTAKSQTMTKGALAQLLLCSISTSTVRARVIAGALYYHLISAQKTSPTIIESATQDALILSLQLIYLHHVMPKVFCVQVFLCPVVAALIHTQHTASTDLALLYAVSQADFLCCLMF